MARSLVRSLALLMASAGVMLVAGCGEDKAVSSATQFKPADVGIEGGPANPGDEDATPGISKTKPKPITVERLDADSMPDGPPAAIIEYLHKFNGYEPRGVTNEARRTDLVRVRRLMMEAADRVLEDETSKPDQRQEAAQTKLAAVVDLAQRGEPKADEELLAYSARLKQDKDPLVSRLGRLMIFSTDVANLQNNDTSDPAPVLAELKSLLELDDPDHAVFAIGNQAALALNQLGHNEEAIEAMLLLGKKYSTDKDADVAGQAKQLLKQTKLVQLDFRGKLTALMSEKPDPKAADEVVAAVQTLLSDKDAAAMELSVAAQTADILERTEHYEAAKQVIELVSTRFADAKDEKLASEAKETVEDSQKRLNLVGQPLNVTGKMLDGQPFDPASLSGKVVLIDFWATWCGPCLAEIPNIKKYYDLYKDKGFEVIGYNLDEQPADVEQFFATQKLPWATITSHDSEKIGFSSPLAVHCGVKSIPFLVLLDTEGKVVALHTRGEKLGEKLAELLGPVEEAAPAADDAEKTK
jgi:thiol-disulfide isomerase/thioredoxin